MHKAIKQLNVLNYCNDSNLLPSDVKEDVRRFMKDQCNCKGELILYEVGFDDDDVTYKALDKFLTECGLKKVYIWCDW